MASLRPRSQRPGPLVSLVRDESVGAPVERDRDRSTPAVQVGIVAACPEGPRARAACREPELPVLPVGGIEHPGRACLLAAFVFERHLCDKVEGIALERHIGQSPLRVLPLRDGNCPSAAHRFAADASVMAWNTSDAWSLIFTPSTRPSGAPERRGYDPLVDRAFHVAVRRLEAEKAIRFRVDPVPHLNPLPEIPQSHSRRAISRRCSQHESLHPSQKVQSGCVHVFAQDGRPEKRWSCVNGRCLAP